LAQRRAIYRAGFGCVGVDPNGGVTRAAASLIDETPKRAGPSSATDDLRTAGEPSPEVHAAALRARDWAFTELTKLPQIHARCWWLRRANHRGRYADGFGVDTALIGWSMTKSVVGAVGILVGSKLSSTRRCR
jgi:hypothetical protein